MEKLYKVVIDAVIKKVFEPKCLAALLSGWIEQNDKSRQARATDLARLRARRTHLEAERANVIKLVRNGVCSLYDSQIASELGQLAAQRANIYQDIELTESQLDQKDTQATPARIESFGRLLTQKLHSPEEKSFRHQYLRLLVNHIEVGDTQISITGRMYNLLAAEAAEAAGLLPNTEQKWCTRLDSNQWRSPSKRTLAQNFTVLITVLIQF